MATLANINVAVDLLNFDDEFGFEPRGDSPVFANLDNMSHEQLILRVGEAEVIIREETNILNACLDRLQENARNRQIK